MSPKHDSRLPHLHSECTAPGAGHSRLTVMMDAAPRPLLRLARTQDSDSEAAPGPGKQHL